MNNLNRKVPIKNVLYMYSYVWEKIEFNDYSFLDNLDDYDSSNILCSLFLKNVKSIIKKGLYREYEEITEEIRGIKGKIDFKESLNNMSFQNSKSYCIYDEFNENNIINMIIKSTALKLYKTTDINEDMRHSLNNILHYFNKVDLIELDSNCFDIRFNKNNLYTYFLIKVCELIYKCISLSEETGSYKFINILDNDEIMKDVYELFVYKFYKAKLEKEMNLFEVYYQYRLDWDLGNGNKDILPKMRIDILISDKKNTIILDTKYYKEYFNVNFEKEKLISNNMYQMVSYMNNINFEQNIRGILLYPLPYDAEPIDEKYNTNIISNGKIKPAKLEFITIDLSKEWNDIESDLLNIILN